MDRTTKQYQRDITNPTAYTYVKQHLDCGSAFSQLIHNLSKQINLADGRVITLVPLETPSERLFPSEPLAYDHSLPVDYGEQSPFELFLRYLETYLLQVDTRICVLAEVLFTSDLEFSKNEAPVRYTAGKEVYFILTGADIKEIDVARLVKNLIAGWCAIIALVSLPDEPEEFLTTRELTVEKLHTLAENTELIAVAAYDGDGFLIWDGSRAEAEPRSLVD
jgi:hypothetical protein